MFRPRGGTGGTPWRAWGPPTKVGGLRSRRGGRPTGRGCQGCLAAWPDGIRGLDSSIRGLVDRPLWGRRAADEGRRLAAPPRGLADRPGVPRMLGGIWGCILSELKEYTPRPPKKNSGGVSIPPPDPSYDQREGCALLWKPSRSLRGFLLRRTLEQGTKDESGVPVVIPGISPCGRRGWGWPGRSRTGIRRL